MKVKVKYYNLLQEAIGRKEAVFQLERSCNLAGLMKVIAGEYGEQIRKMLFQETGALATHIRIFVDDRMVYDLYADLKDGAEVALFYAVVGG